MSEIKYYEREYNYLQTAGEEFAKKYQEIAGLLRLDDRHHKDPFVERLFEAFAFLSGRIHERLDDEIPEFAAGLLEQLFPHFLRPFPSCAILQASTITGAITQPVLVPRGSEIQTRVGAYQVRYKVAASPIEKKRTEEIREPAEFIFRTTRDFYVYPMKLRSVSVETSSSGRSALVLQFQPHRNVTYEALLLDRFVLYLHGDYRLRHTLLLYLTKYVESLAVRELSDLNAKFQPIEGFRIEIPGLNSDANDDDEQAILPYARQTFTGYRTLQEYFAFPDRFFFIEIHGLEKFQASDEGHPFEIRIAFNRPFSGEFRPTIKDILINCVPIVNLFDRPTEPVHVNRRMPEYYVIPDADRRKSREIYSINRVVGVDRNQKSLYHYTPITSYDILDTNDPEYDFKRFYSYISRPIPGDMAETYIRLFGPSLEQDEFPEETLSIDATMTNGFLPSKYVQIGHINQPVNFPEGITASNLDAPRAVLPCPQQQNFLWALISHLTVSFATLAETETLKAILSLYDWSIKETSSNRKKIHEGIVKVYPPATKNIYRRRAVIRGIEFKMDIDPHKFENGEGDIHLFGLALSRFLTQYVTINSFVILTLVDVETKKEYTWEPTSGQVLIV